MLQDMMSKESFLDSKKKLAANPIIVPENISKEEIIAKAEED